MMQAVLADITQLQADAIVNAANQTLLGGGGVDGAIHRAAGPELLTECKKLGGCPTGAARITPGYRLPARYVIHTVGPVWRGGRAGEAELLRQCYLNALKLAAAHGCRTVAFPCISTGVYGYPGDAAAGIAVRACAEFHRDHPEAPSVIFCCFNRDDLERYRALLASGEFD